MPDNHRVEAVVLRGIWLYDGTLPAPIEVIARNFDSSYDPDDEDYPDWRPTLLGAEGVLYFLHFPSGPSSAGGAFRSLRELKAWAAQQPWAPVAWADEN